ncbi:MAG: hypothetical protein QM622_03775 [Microbacterium sp.]
MDASENWDRNATLAALEDQEIAAILHERRYMDTEPLSDVAARFGVNLKAL